MVDNKETANKNDPVMNSINVDYNLADDVLKRVRTVLSELQPILSLIPSQKDRLSSRVMDRINLFMPHYAWLDNFISKMLLVPDIIIRLYDRERASNLEPLLFSWFDPQWLTRSWWIHHDYPEDINISDKLMLTPDNYTQFHLDPEIKKVIYLKSQRSDNRTFTIKGVNAINNSGLPIKSHEFVGRPLDQVFPNVINSPDIDLPIQEKDSWIQRHSKSLLPESIQHHLYRQQETNKFIGSPLNQVFPDAVNSPDVDLPVREKDEWLRNNQYLITESIQRRLYKQPENNKYVGRPLDQVFPNAINSPDVDLPIQEKDDGIQRHSKSLLPVTKSFLLPNRVWKSSKQYNSESVDRNTQSLTVKQVTDYHSDKDRVNVSEESKGAEKVSLPLIEAQPQKYKEMPILQKLNVGKTDNRGFKPIMVPFLNTYHPKSDSDEQQETLSEHGRFERLAVDYISSSNNLAAEQTIPELHDVGIVISNNAGAANYNQNQTFSGLFNGEQGLFNSRIDVPELALAPVIRQVDNRQTGTIVKGEDKTVRNRYEESMGIDTEKLAADVYAILKRRLLIERERLQGISR